jgi:hypothetical protein
MIPRTFAFVCCMAIFCAGSMTLAANKASRARNSRVSDSSSASRAKFLDGRGTKVESSEDQLTTAKRSSRGGRQKAAAKDDNSDLQVLVQRMEDALDRMEEKSDSGKLLVAGTSTSCSNRCGSGVSGFSTSSSRTSNSGVWMVVRRNATVVPLSSLTTLSSPVVSGLTVQNVAPFGTTSILSSGNAVSSFGNGITSFSGTRAVTRSPFTTLHYRGAAAPCITPSASYPYATFTGASQFTVSSGEAIAPAPLVVGGSTVYSVPSAVVNCIP